MKAVALIWDKLLLFNCDGITQTESLATAEDAGDVILRLLAAAPLKPAAVRLIYQPADLVSEPIDVPLAARGKINKTLTHDYPALAHNLAPWSCQALLPGDRGAQTLLNFEKSPKLAELLRKITTAGFTIDGVFPLLTLLELLPAAHTTGRSVVIAHTDSHCLIYSREASGIRTTAVFATEAEPLALDYFFTSSVTANQPTPVVEILYLAPQPWPFATYTAPAVPPAHKLDAFLQEAWRISPRDLSNFAPLSPYPSLDSLVLGLGCGLFIAALCIGIRQELNYRQSAADLSLKQTRHTELSKELTLRQEHAAGIKKADTILADLGATPPGLTDLLRTLEAKLPREITVTGLKIQERDFTLDFELHVASEQNGPFFSFVDAFATHPAWLLLTPKPTKAAAGAFTLTGRFK
jgi:hypothetical protein